MKITIKRGSVVYADCDCIVNAANQSLIQGGGVCGAIFYKARGRLTEECNAIGHCPTGHAVMTNGYKLKAKHIIHAVGPSDGDETKLKEAFYNTLVIADSNNFKTIGLVPISVGIYGFPLKKCASIAIDVISKFKAKSLQTCFMYCYQDDEYDAFINELTSYQKNNK